MSKLKPIVKNSNRRISQKVFLWLTIEETMSKLECSRLVLMKYIDSGLLPVYESKSGQSEWGAGKRLFIHKRDLTDFMEEYAE